MSAGIWFWIIYVLCVLFGFWALWPAAGGYHVLAFPGVVFVLIGLLGWGIFGPPIQSGRSPG